MKLKRQGTRWRYYSCNLTTKLGSSRVIGCQITKSFDQILSSWMLDMIFFRAGRLPFHRKGKYSCRDSFPKEEHNWRRWTLDLNWIDVPSGVIFGYFESWNLGPGALVRIITLLNEKLKKNATNNLEIID